MLCKGGAGADGASWCAGMPIGLQLMGRPWAEASLLYAGSVLEAAVRPLIRLPSVSYDVLYNKPQ